GRVDVEAAADEHLALPPAEVEVAGVVEEAHVARVHPAVGVDGGRGGLRVAPVAHHRRGRADDDLARRPRGHGRVPLVDDAELDARRGRSGWSSSITTWVGMPPRCSRRSRSIVSSTAAGSKVSWMSVAARCESWIAMRAMVPTCANERPAARCFAAGGAPGG